MNHPSQPVQLAREIGLREATALNMIDMIGVGPFITLPLIIHAMHGPQAMVGWILGALLAMCDGLVWAELGASLPQAGGSYQYLKESFGPQKLGRMISFLFVWQLMFSAPLSIASGCIGIARYAAYLWEPVGRVLVDRTFSAAVPFLGSFYRSHYEVVDNGRRFLVNTIAEGTSSPPITIVLNWTAGLKK